MGPPPVTLRSNKHVRSPSPTGRVRRQRARVREPQAAAATADAQSQDVESTPPTTTAATADEETTLSLMPLSGASSPEHEDARRSVPESCLQHVDGTAASAMQATSVTEALSASIPQVRRRRKGCQHANCADKPEEERRGHRADLECGRHIGCICDGHPRKPGFDTRTKHQVDCPVIAEQRVRAEEAARQANFNATFSDTAPVLELFITVTASNRHVPYSDDPEQPDWLRMGAELFSSIGPDIMQWFVGVLEVGDVREQRHNHWVVEVRLADSTERTLKRFADMIREYLKMDNTGRIGYIAGKVKVQLGDVGRNLKYVSKDSAKSWFRCITSTGESISSQTWAQLREEFEMESYGDASRKNLLARDLLPNWIYKQRQLYDGAILDMPPLQMLLFAIRCGRVRLNPTFISYGKGRPIDAEILYRFHGIESSCSTVTERDIWVLFMSPRDNDGRPWKNFVIDSDGDVTDKELVESVHFDPKYRAARTLEDCVHIWDGLDSDSRKQRPPPWPHARASDSIDSTELRMFQASVKAVVTARRNLLDRVWVLCLCDPVGGQGKSTLAQHLVARSNFMYLTGNCLLKDAATAVQNHMEVSGRPPSGLVVDISRSSGQTSDLGLLWGIIEEIASGTVHVGKYRSSTLMFNPISVLLLTNNHTIDAVGTHVSADRIVSIEVTQFRHDLECGMPPPTTIRQLAYISTTWSQDIHGTVTQHAPTTRGGDWIVNEARTDDAAVYDYIARHTAWEMASDTIVPESGDEFSPPPSTLHSYRHRGPVSDVPSPLDEDSGHVDEAYSSFSNAVDAASQSATDMCSPDTCRSVSVTCPPDSDEVGDEGTTVATAILIDGGAEPEEYFPCRGPCTWVPCQVPSAVLRECASAACCEKVHLACFVHHDAITAEQVRDTSSSFRPLCLRCLQASR